MENSEILKTNIQGWGTDLDQKNRPAVPMWSKPKEGTGAHWKIPERQQVRFKEFHSIERPGMTAVFGATVKPSGLSGLIRAFAFKFGEAEFTHWLALLFADRVNMVEGIFSDLLRGHIPNFYKEMGLGAELKYNRQAVVKKAVVVGVFAAAAVTLFMIVKNSKKDNSDPSV
jgi:hypothetical protein